MVLMYSLELRQEGNTHAPLGEAVGGTTIGGVAGHVVVARFPEGNAATRVGKLDLVLRDLAVDIEKQTIFANCFEIGELCVCVMQIKQPSVPFRSYTLG